MDAETRARLLGIFFAEAEETLATLERLVEPLALSPSAEPFEEFGRLAHGLKGSTAAMGMLRLSEVLHGLEQLGLDVQKASGAPRQERHRRLSRLVRALQATVQALQASGEDDLSEASSHVLRSLLFEPQATTRKVAGRKASPTTARTDAPARPPAPALTPPQLTPPSANRLARQDASGSLTPTTGRTDAGDGSRPGSKSRSARPTTPAAPQSERLTVSSDDVSQALALASALSRSATSLEEALRERGLEFSAAMAELATGSERLEALLFDMRLVPASEALAGLDDEVEALGERLGKRATLHLHGLQVRADRRTLQAARMLLRHLLRNALDHGLEAPEARVAAGKPPVGRVEISLAMSEARLEVRVDDDGAGFDVAAIRARLLGQSPELAAAVSSLSDAEVVQRFAEQGGSTRPEANDLSGRGMGLSAVAAAARAQGGDFVVASTSGQGSRVTFWLPLEVFAAEVLTVRLGERMLGLPLASVQRSLHLSALAGAVQKSPTGMTLAVDERIIPLYALAAATGLPGEGAGRYAVVVRADAREAAFSVDDVGFNTRVVPRPVPPAVTAETLVTGVALLPDGDILQVLNPRLLLEAGRRTGGVNHHLAPAAPARPAPSRHLEVLLAEDSLATREVLRVLLVEQGFTVRVAGDGEEALSRINEKLPDVVVSDVNMPRRDGLSLTRALRAGPLTARLPIILLTSQDDEPSRQAGAAAGADAYLIKSRFTAEVLSQTLLRLGVL